MPYNAYQHIDTYLTNLSVGYQYPELIADKLAPPVYVSKRSDLYRIYGGEAMRIPAGNGYVADGAPTDGISYQLSPGSYYCKGYGFHEKIPLARLANTDSEPDVLRRNGLFLVKHVTETMREKVVASALQTPYSTGTSPYLSAAVSPNAYADNNAVQWDHPSTSSHPIKELLALKAAIVAATGMIPNVAWFAYNSWLAFQNHADVRDYIKYSAITATTTELVARLLEVDEVVIGRGINITANEGQTQTVSPIWSGTAGLLYRMASPSNSPSIEESYPRAFTQFIWTAPELGAAADGAIVQNWLEKREHSEYVEYMKHSDFRATFSGAAGMLKRLTNGSPAT